MSDSHRIIKCPRCTQKTGTQPDGTISADWTCRCGFSGPFPRAEPLMSDSQQPTLVERLRQRRDELLRVGDQWGAMHKQALLSIAELNGKAADEIERLQAKYEEARDTMLGNLGIEKGSQAWLE